MSVRAGHKAVVSDFDNIGVTISKTSNESVTSSTTFQNDDQLVLPLAASATYAFEAFLIYDGSTAGDLKLQFTGPSGCAMNWANFANVSGAASATLTYGPIMNTLAQVTPQGIACNGATAMCARPAGIVINGSTSGNLQLKWAQVASNATATRILIGSWMKITRMNL